MVRVRSRPRGREPRRPRKFPLSPAGPGTKRTPPTVRIIPLRTPSFWLPDDLEPDPRGKGKRPRIRKPRVPWTRPRRPRGAREYAECGGPRIFRDQYDSAQSFAAAVRKRCGPKKLAREFNVGGLEAGTLVGARRAPGLFDDNWGTPFPLTRAEQRALQEGRDVPDPFFEPPTTPNPGNWIADRLEQLRRRMSPTSYTTTSAMRKLCGDAGFGLTCAGPDGEIGWTGGDRPLTKEEAQEFLDAYCAPGKCLEGGKVTPPAGFREFIITTRPKNVAVARRLACGPPPPPPAARRVFAEPAPAPPPTEIAQPGLITKGCPPGHYWAIGMTGIRCVPFGIGAPPATAGDLAYFGIVP